MGRYLLFFSYIGTRYRGLQKQTGNTCILDVDCVQGAIESAFNSVLPRLISGPDFTSSSRTDAGVHALETAAHVEIENKCGLLYRPESLTRYLNRYLMQCRHEIRILNCIPITEKFHARFSAKSRTYIYRFIVPKRVGDIQVPIIEMNRSSVIRSDEFDIEKIREGTKLFVGLKDFASFAAANKTNRPINYRRTLNEVTLEKTHALMPLDPLAQNFDYWQIKCKGRSFLHNQVRRMVGALFALGSGRVTEKDIITMLQVPSSSNWNTKISPAPPTGLYLLKVEYDPAELKENIIYNEKEFLSPTKLDK